MIRGNAIAIELKGDGRQAVFLELAAAIVTEIERGRLKPGDPLPGTRGLARSLGLNRNTVDAAYHELLMQGWLVAEPSRGTFVAHDLPELSAAAGRGRRAVPVETRATTPRPTINFCDGSPDPRLLPSADLARAFRRALAAPAFLAAGSYGDVRGSPALRQALAGYLGDERGLVISADEVLVTRGSQMALFLAASAALEPGQTIAVEVPGYPLAWAAFRAAGARIVGIPVDGGGLDIGRLSELALSEPGLKAVYATPHHQYPTTVTLGAGRRLKLMEIARRHGLTVIEDDYDHEYRFDGRPVLPLAARADQELRVVYVGSLSKLLAPGIRVGYAVASGALLQRMADRREAIDRQGDQPLEQALAALIEDGTMRRHARKARRIYAERRACLAGLLTEALGDKVSFTVPAGGLALWLRLEQGLSAESWAGKAAALGLSVMPGIRFALDPANPPEAFRVGFGSLNATELKHAVELLASACP
ncbi:GntR family transcriptional regulator [Mesorhizobium sp. L-8-10]|uniref:MocR-like pyridoxine biosynthesis transcription factor PdxR n=1 Tax=unclassified Mesorhizobium TaxID=325217 RepID=UPI0019261210|nr:MULTISPECIES: PLP-dependent aminotransferase family protein [unclassified Mesorhizobium]BCH21735.1 GntR family transcriptional regulator [Mesorhizobium sp. L-8-3]BCH29422.1 GntR family transcriptional regulator [Mesorhizobium sp. L-8-10]